MRPPLTEEYYLRELATERRLYAWCMIHVGGRTEQEALQAATDFYKYEPPEEEHRWLVFHRLAWQWAMVHLFDFDYHLKHPEFASPSAEYERLAREMYDEPPA